MINLKKILVIHLFLGTLFALHGKIVFFDGTYVVGKVTKVDEATVYIIPIGLDTPEGVLVGNIDSLKLENGIPTIYKRFLANICKHKYQDIIIPIKLITLTLK